jgi:hypothetical protein
MHFGTAEHHSASEYPSKVIGWSGGIPACTAAADAAMSLRYFFGYISAIFCLSFVERSVFSLVGPPWSENSSAGKA